MTNNSTVVACKRFSVRHSLLRTPRNVQGATEEMDVVRAQGHACRARLRAPQDMRIAFRGMALVPGLANWGVFAGFWDDPHPGKPGPLAARRGSPRARAAPEALPDQTSPYVDESKWQLGMYDVWAVLQSRAIATPAHMVWEADRVGGSPRNPTSPAAPTPPPQGWPTCPARAGGGRATSTWRPGPSS